MGKLEKFDGLTRKTMAPSYEKRFYVYGLLDPKDNSLFYIGKGTGDRVFSHEKDANGIKK